MTAHSLDAAGLRALMGTFRDALVAHRTTLNLLNVYPVPDGDTGSNMTMTVDSVCADLEALDQTADMDAVAGAIAHGSLMGARGNSGVILSQVLRGLSATFSQVGTNDPQGTIDGRLLADGMAAAATAAYGAVMTPVEGTILTVVRESAEAAVVAADGGADLLGVAEASRMAGGESLARTPELLPVLAEAGVVDAGGCGFLLLLDAVLTTIDGRPIPEPVEVAAPLSINDRPDDHGGESGLGTQYEVMYFLDAPDEAVESFKGALGRPLGTPSLWWAVTVSGTATSTPTTSVELWRPASPLVAPTASGSQTSSTRLENRPRNRLGCVSRWPLIEVTSATGALCGGRGGKRPGHSRHLPVARCATRGAGWAVDEPVHGRPACRRGGRAGQRGGAAPQQRQHHCGG
ncbi:MAG: hypothetical protein Ct9H300mP12_11170 [Acidimicrobiales bacterium]|nr:MAG: hypothetical protein Ct9H300mP12_11170 [Acidimicrobiales bacterium]